MGTEDPELRECIFELKAKMPPMDHAALESRLQSLLNDPDTDNADIIGILRREFDPAR